MIRAYHKHDDDQIISLWRKSSDLAHPFLSSDFQDQEALNIRNIYLPNTKTWVFEKEGQILGFIGMIDHEIGAIFVDPEYMNQGIGFSLLEAVKPLFSSLIVKVFKKNKIGRGFYQKRGFQQIGEELHDPTQEMLLILKLDTGTVL